MFFADLLISLPFLFWILGIIIFIFHALQLSINSSSLYNNLVFSLGLIQLNFYFLLLSENWDSNCWVFLFNNNIVLSPVYSTIQLLLVTFFSCFLSVVVDYLIWNSNFFFEIFIFLVFSLLGFLLVLCSNNLVLFFLSFELQAFAIYGLASYKSNSVLASEAVLNYFVLGALFSSLVLLGLSFLYGSFGTLSLTEISFLSIKEDWVLFCGFTLVTFGILFNLGVFPFHQWVAEVYESVDNLVAMFFSYFPKLALILFLNQTLAIYFAVSLQSLESLFYFLGLSSVIIGCIFSMGQIKLNSLLAFSGIAQIGYLTLVITSTTQISLLSILVYLIFYSITIIHIWLNILFFQSENFLFINDFIGFNNNNIIYSSSILILFLSLSGMPPMAGFWSNMLIFISLLDQNLYILVFLVTLWSAVSVLYYLNLVYISFFNNIGNYTYNKFYLGLSNTIYIKFIVLFIYLNTIFFTLFVLFNFEYILSFLFNLTFLMII